MAKPNLLGPWGEALAAEYLRKKHYHILACNYRCRFGEIDLIAANRKELVFVEVKLRAPDAIALPREFVDSRKRERLRKTASAFLSRYELDAPARFDVAEVWEEKDGMLRLTYLEGAFT